MREISTLVQETLTRLQRHASPARQDFTEGYFPTSMRILGVTTADLRDISKTLAQTVQPWRAQEVIELGIGLIESHTFEGRQVAYELLTRHKPALAALDTATLERLGAGIDNWASVDTFSVYLSGPAWRRGQVPDALIAGWARSPDRWWRRAALVSTVSLNLKSRGGTGDPARTLAVCEMLVADRDDMVGKGLSWALRELAKRTPDQVEAFLASHDDRLQARVRREVRTRLSTGLKNRRRGVDAVSSQSSGRKPGPKPTRKPDPDGDDELLRFALELVEQAGALALTLQEKCLGVRKPDRTLVSEADLQVQALIREAIFKRYPGHAFLGEEDEGIAQSLSGDAVQAGLWIVDPVDGTDSFLRQLPTWAVSLGLATGGKPRVGVVALPASREVFCAVAGGVALRNGKPIRVRDDVALDHESILLAPSQLHLYVDIGFPGKLRSYGCTSAHMCFVAAGSVHAAVFGGARPWDVFAAGIVLEAAGGGIFKLDGSKLDLAELAREQQQVPVVVATTAPLARPVYETLRLKRG